MELLLRILIYLVVGTVLLACNILYVRSIASSLKKDETIILPITIIGQEDKDGKLGTAIASMLALRIKTVQWQIAKTQEATSKNVQVFHPAAIHSDASPLDPIKIDAKVAGVDVGTLLPWVQNFLSRPNGVTFTLDFLDKDRVLVIGDLRTIAHDNNAVVSFQSSASHDKVVDDLAHVILQAQLQSRMHNGVDSISVGEFESVVQNLSRVAQINDSIANGQIAQSSELTGVLDALRPVALKLPGWWQLNYVAALVAQRTADSNAAIALYSNVKKFGSSHSPSPELVALLKSGEVDRAIENLSKAPAKETSVDEEFFPEDTSAEAERARPIVEAEVDYAYKLYERLFSLQRPRPKLHLFKGNEINAFWVATENAFYAPAAVQFTPDVVYHEIAHIFIGSLGKLAYEGQSGAIVESYADICAQWVSQVKSGQTAQNADWTIGRGFPALIENKDPRKDRRPIRSFTDPKSGFDVAVDNVRALPQKTDSSYIHRAIGISNKAFYETAIKIGTDKAITIWIAAIPQLRPNATMQDLASATEHTALSLMGDPIAAKLIEAWAVVGIGGNSPDPESRAETSR